MIVEVQVSIRASREAVWRAITDIEGSAKFVRGIEKIEVVERPEGRLVGLRWRETRIFFGKPATVEKTITDAAPGESYATRAEDDGCVYLSTLRIAGSGDGVTLTSVHESRARGFVARMMLPVMGLFFKGVARKALLQDLEDFKAAVEGGLPGGPRP
jgi:uncharacterized protein YndB with AHSA1/START domain